MKESKPEQPQKDDEIEISNLDSSLSSPSRKPRFAPRQCMLIVILLNALLILALVLILINTASIHELVNSVFVRPTPVPSPVITRWPSSVLFPTFPANARLGLPGCLPPSPLDPSNAGIPERQGQLPPETCGLSS